jgi:hypothetical protein
MSDFHLYALDEDFDLIDGPLPDSLEFKFGDQLDRARTVLKGRSLNQIRFGLESLDWMLRKGGDMLMKEALKSSTEKGVFIDRVKALHALMNSGEVEIDNPDVASRRVLGGLFCLAHARLRGRGSSHG